MGSGTRRTEMANRWLREHHRPTGTWKGQRIRVSHTGARKTAKQPRRRMMDAREMGCDRPERHRDERMGATRPRQTMAGRRRRQDKGEKGGTYPAQEQASAASGQTGSEEAEDVPAESERTGRAGVSGPGGFGARSLRARSAERRTASERPGGAERDEQRQTGPETARTDEGTSRQTERSASRRRIGSGGALALRRALVGLRDSGREEEKVARRGEQKAQRTSLSRRGQAGTCSSMETLGSTAARNAQRPPAEGQTRDLPRSGHPEAIQKRTSASRRPRRGVAVAVWSRTVPYRTVSGRLRRPSRFGQTRTRDPPRRIVVPRPLIRLSIRALIEGTE